MIVRKCVCQLTPCAKCNKNYRPLPCSFCRGPSSIAKCATCNAGYCSAKCKKEARKHTCVLPEPPPCHENQYIGGFAEQEVFGPDTIAIKVDNTYVACLTKEVYQFIYGTKRNKLLLTRAKDATMHPCMSEQDMYQACTDAIKLFHAHIIHTVNRCKLIVPTGILLLECSSYIDFARKIIDSGRALRWCGLEELVGGKPAVDGPNREQILRDIAAGAIVIRVSVQHPDKFDPQGYAMWSYNTLFTLTT